MAKGKRGAPSGDKSLTATVDHKAFDKFAAELPGSIDGEVTDALRRLGDQFVGETVRKLRSGPAGKYGTRSRQDAARGVGFDTRDGKLILRSDPSTMPADRRAFPAAWNQGRWTHPVYGGRARVSQRGNTFWQPEQYARTAEQLLTDAGQRGLDKADK